MAIQPAEIKYYQSTTAPSIGGAINLGAEITTATLGNLFDTVSGAESASGDVEYRCLYVRNTNPSLTLQNAKVWIDTQTPSGHTIAEIALGNSAVNGVETATADENTEPAFGPSWTALTGEGNALTIGDIPAGQHKAIWVKRTVSAGATAYNPDNVLIRVGGETAA